jgi:hypothetical protein
VLIIDLILNSTNKKCKGGEKEELEKVFDSIAATIQSLQHSITNISEISYNHFFQGMANFIALVEVLNLTPEQTAQIKKLSSEHLEELKKQLPANFLKKGD